MNARLIALATLLDVVISLGLLVVFGLSLRTANIILCNKSERLAMRAANL